MSVAGRNKISLTIDPQGGGAEKATGSPSKRVVGPIGLVDKDLLLNIALGIEDNLEARGLRVAMTRRSDRNLSQAKRLQVARDSASKIFVSLRFADALDPDKQCVGAKVHALAGRDSSVLARRLQSALSSALGYPESKLRREKSGMLRPDRLPDGIGACEITICSLAEAAAAESLADPSHIALIARTLSDALYEFVSPNSTGTEARIVAPSHGDPSESDARHDLPIATFQSEETARMASIVIDPGHGGTSNLPCSSWNNAIGLSLGTLEKGLTLDVALRVEKELSKRGYTNVALTRTTDVNVGGRERARLAQSTNADVLLSIHFNASTNHNAQGTETFIHRDNSITGSSAVLCRSVQAAVLRATGLRDRNAYHPPHFVKTAGWCVINPRDHAPNTAAVLTEVSFLDRPKEEARLQRESYLEEIAFAIVDGIEDYLTPAASLDALALSDGVELEDAVSQAAYEAGLSVEAMMTDSHPIASRAPVAGSEQGGHAMAEAVPALTNRAGASLHDIARALSAPVPGAADQSDERGEEAHIHGDDALDLSGFGQDADADIATISRLFGSDMAALQQFDHPAFADKVRGWNLRYFQPIELLFLGGQNQSPGDACYGKNSLPPPHLWDRMEATIKMLDEVRHRLGGPIRITSAFRNDAYNECIKGRPLSKHKEFNAIDFTSPVGSVPQWHALAKQVRSEDRAYKGGIGDYPAQNFVHIDTRGVVVDF